MEKEKDTIELAYNIGLKSNELQATLLIAVNASLDRFIAWISSVTIGSITLAGATIENIDFNTYWLYIAIILFLLSVIMGIVSRAFGRFFVLSPAKIDDEDLTFTKIKFMKEIYRDIKYNFEDNKTVINNKGKIITMMSILFICEIFALMMWIIGAFKF